MADNNKQHAGWLDIPDGNGGLTRTWFADVDLRQQVSQLSPAGTATVSETTAAAAEISFTTSNNAES